MARVCYGCIGKLYWADKVEDVEIVILVPCASSIVNQELSFVTVFVDWDLGTGVNEKKDTGDPSLE